MRKLGSILMYGLLAVACSAAGSKDNGAAGTGAAGSGVAASGGAGSAGTGAAGSAAGTGAAGSGGSAGSGAASGAGGSGGSGGSMSDAGNVQDSGPPASCTGLSPQSLDREAMLQVGGRSRSFLVHVPASYDPSVPMPLLFNFHGAGGNANGQADYTFMREKADAAGFIAVHAQGFLANFFGTTGWNAGKCCGDALQMNIDDVAFVTAMLAELEATLCIDTRRIYAAGFSNGGFFSYRLACEMADRFAAVANVGGVIGVDSCTPSRPVPVIHFHGNGDQTVQYDGTANPCCGGQGPWPSVPDTMDGWVMRNGCDASPAMSYQNGATTCQSYPGCDSNADVTLCIIEGGGHTWPGGESAGDTGISATDAMWDFFAAHPMP